ncbi:outer membrane protein assembly factor [Rhizobium lentis]|nr:outer membrane protein assembly factor [Rhizobium lentis]MBX5054766.1 outer membrane protein assembly factor [Rhizobium lentis]MBX5070264.1 outer membrane protein assembly factor [Rhizobium lentis]MBX5109824.1 outer membrane protein assembly factor [Rhizobium lentis]MBX5115686.1 outer membrane protein assembly factor [Rhizobium lentis]
MMVMAAAAAFSPVLIGDAYAFKLFGITIFGKEEDEGEQVPDPVRYTVDLKADSADPDLKKALENSSRLVSDQKRPVSGDLGIVVKARDDRDRLIAALYEKARYGGVVTITIDGRNIDDLPPNPTFDRSAPIPVTVDIVPGPVFRVKEVQFGGDAASRNPADYDLAPGAEAGSLAIIKAGEKIVEQLKSEGRPFAKLTERKVVADHRNDTVDIVLAAEGGPVAPIGDVGVTGEKTVRPGFIQRYSRLNKGEAYSPEALKKAGERLRALGVFSSVTIHEGDALAPDGTLPMTIEVSEGKRRYFGVGAQYSTTDGFGVQGYWGHRNLFGEAETLRIEGSVSRLGETTDVGSLDYSAGILFTKPGAFFPAATLKAGIVAKTQNPDAYNATLVTASLGLSYELTDQDTVSASGEVRWERDDDAFGTNDYLTVALPLQYDRDARDDKLNPTEGYRATVSAKPGYEVFNATPYAAFEGSISGYLPFGAEDGVVLAGKVAAGTLVSSGGIENIPATQRFFAGGGGSVRGYAYQEISPYNDDGDATGGRSYVTGSLEARIKITDTIGIVPFIDVGTVADSTFPGFSDIRAGAGAGIRYATPFGPLRLDFAVPLNKYEDGTDYGIYAGIGQSF